MLGEMENIGSTCKDRSNEQYLGSDPEYGGKKNRRSTRNMDNLTTAGNCISGSIYWCPYMRDEQIFFIIDPKSMQVISNTDST